MAFCRHKVQFCDTDTDLDHSVKIYACKKIHYIKNMCLKINENKVPVTYLTPREHSRVTLNSELNFLFPTTGKMKKKKDL